MMIPCRDPLQPFLLGQASSWLFSPIPARFSWRHQRWWLPWGSNTGSGHFFLPWVQHPCVPEPCGSPPCTGAGWRLFPMAASTARSHPQVWAIPESTTLPPGILRVLLVLTRQWDLGLSTAAWERLLSLAAEPGPFPALLAGGAQRPRSSPDTHPARPRQEGLRAKSSSPRGEVR